MRFASLLDPWRWLSLVLIVSWTHPADSQLLSRYVTDRTGSLNENELALLEQTLSDFDKTSSTQIVVVVATTIGSASLEETSLRIAEENGIGGKSKNNGALLFVAKNDRKMRIEVGYGLEGVLTDALCGQIIRNEIAPKFRQGRIFEGIRAGVDAIIAATRNEYTVEPSDTHSKGWGVLPIILIVVMFLFISSRGRRKGFPGGGGIPIFFPGGGERSGGFRGGGGGFSGGGGSFGGGGSSGSW